VANKQDGGHLRKGRQQKYDSGLSTTHFDQSQGGLIVEWRHVHAALPHCCGLETGSHAIDGQYNVTYPDTILPECVEQVRRNEIIRLGKRGVVEFIKVKRRH